MAQSYPVLCCMLNGSEFVCHRWAVGVSNLEDPAVNILLGDARPASPPPPLPPPHPPAAFSGTYSVPGQIKLASLELEFR